MDHYIDIQILPNPEIEAPLVMNQLFYQLHLLLVDRKSNLGISFPEYIDDPANEKKLRLGSRIRLHGTAEQLAILGLAKRSDIADYAFISEIMSVPAEVKQHAIFVRKHSKSPRDIERKRQYLIKKAGGEWNEQAEESLKRFIDKLRCQLPFIHLASHSSVPAKGIEKNHFYLFIDKRVSAEKKGQFTKYGLSDPGNHASVPIF